METYELAKVWEDGELVLWRGTRADGARVLATSPASNEVTSLAWLQRAAALRDELAPGWAARPIELVEHGRPMLISEDPGGELLASQRGWPLEARLRVAIGLAVAVGQLHARGLIHKDLKPANVLADPATGAVWLTGFGNTSRLPRERQLPEPPEEIAGTLAYMAPEQTGRMNRSIDSRSDLYALGVTLYELLSGSLPFSAADPMEWVHCHIARQPTPLHTRAPGLPPAIAAIVMKLLAKTAEARYQTARGVELDLRRALDEWQATGGVTPFPPGERDASNRLLIPEQLYGRDAEIGVLLSSFERVVARGDTQLVLVSGYSGIGKSSVVNELHRVLVPPRGLYASGKFDQYKRDIPYATLAQAFQILIRQILGKSAQELASWRDRLTRAVGAHGQLIAKLVPELELVIGRQPVAPELPPNDAQARFQLVVRRFLGVFAQPEHPLALFLDDLQWLDAATLDLLEHLVSDPEVRDLLVVGAYRENEVGPSHPLAATLARIRERSDRVREIVLTPLQLGDIVALCADALHQDAAQVQPLAELVHDKTGGNPFFAIQFITSLVDEELLRFEPALPGWRWDIAAIRAKGFTDNIVELMAGRLHRLPAITQSALRQLACLGNTARTQTLSLVYGITEAGIHAALEDVVVAGLVLRAPGGYAFLHDRVHEAAYALIPEAARAAEHLRIGNLLAVDASPEELEANIFEIVNHLDRGAALLTSQIERDRVARLNRIAGQRAKASTAHAAARSYVATAQALLGPDRWTRSFRLAFDLELQLADCEFLTGDLQAAEERLDALALHATSPVDRAAVLDVQSTLYTAMAGRTDRAIQLCLAYLRHVGIVWSAHPTSDVVRAEYDELLVNLAGRSVEALVRLPISTDPERNATLDVLIGVATPAFNSDHDLACLVLCRIANLSLVHGYSNASPMAFALLSMVLGGTFADYRTGAMIGKLAVALVEQRGLERNRGRIYHAVGTHLLPWTEPLANAEAAIRQGIRIMREVGDVTYSVFAYCGLVTNHLVGAAPLDRAQADAEIGLGLARQVKFEMGADIFLGQLRLIRAARGLMADPCTLDAEGRAFSSTLTVGWFWSLTMQACVLFGDHATALTAARRARTVLVLSPGFIECAEYCFYAALVHAAALDTAEDPAEHRAELAAHHHRLVTWASHNPGLFDHRVALIDAELARTEGRPLDAMAAYERAIAGARKEGFPRCEGLAFETAARFYAGRGFEMIAHTYLGHARAGYLRWGALGKVRQLDRLQAPPLEPARAAPFVDLDLATVVKTSQAVTAEIGLENLIETLMVIALEHAGAERGLLILPRDGELHIEAEASTGDPGVVVRLRRVIARHPALPESLLHYVSRTQDLVLLADAQAPHAFSTDPYLRETGARSVVCIPLVKQAELVGILYLENNLTPHVFTHARIAVLKLLASQAATSLENASLEEENATLGEKESLLKEVHHRVKNNLQLISSLLNLQASRVTDPGVAELFAESRNRVRAMALVHENLYRAGNFAKIPMATHVRTLCAHLSRAYGLTSQNIELTTKVSDVHLEMNRAVSCGLIINELLSNALKHAFPDGRAGRVWVELDADADGRNVLVVGDDGVGLADVDVAHTDSLGLQLVRDLTEQLHGTVEVRRDPGATFTITFGTERRRAAR